MKAAPRRELAGAVVFCQWMLLNRYGQIEGVRERRRTAASNCYRCRSLGGIVVAVGGARAHPEHSEGDESHEEPLQAHALSAGEYQNETTEQRWPAEERSVEDSLAGGRAQLCDGGVGRYRERGGDCRTGAVQGWRCVGEAAVDVGG